MKKNVRIHFTVFMSLIVLCMAFSSGSVVVNYYYGTTYQPIVLPVCFALLAGAYVSGVLFMVRMAQQ